MKAGIKTNDNTLKNMPPVYNLGVLGHFAPWDILGLRGIRKFWLKNQARKIVSIHKNFEL